MTVMILRLSVRNVKVLRHVLDLSILVVEYWDCEGVGMINNSFFNDK